MTTYYIYALVDPRNDLPFYIGKGCGPRAQRHLYNINCKENKHKESRIKAIRDAGLEPLINYLVENIDDESLAYDLEAQFIKHYGRKGYDPNGLLTNVCLDARPPNHKGKTYEEIYGRENAAKQRAKRAQLQRERGGYGPKQHSAKSKALFRQLNGGLNNPNSSGLTAEDMLQAGHKFCVYYDNKISNKKWQHWCKLHNLPAQRRTFRFDQDIFEVFKDKFGAHITHDSMLWFYNPTTNKNWRCFDWELKWVSVPEGFIRGRGKIKK